MTPQEADPDLPVSIQESPAEAWVGGGLLQGQSHRVRQCAPDHLREVAIIFIAPTIVWSQVKQQGGNTAPPINRKSD